MLKFQSVLVYWSDPPRCLVFGWRNWNLHAAEGSYQIRLCHSWLTCVWHHQPASSVAKHCGCFVQRPAVRLKGLLSEKVSASSAQRCPYRNLSVVWSQAPWKCLRVGHDVVLCPFCHPWGQNKSSETRRQHLKVIVINFSIIFNRFYTFAMRKQATAGEQVLFTFWNMFLVQPLSFKLTSLKATSEQGLKLQQACLYQGFRLQLKQWAWGNKKEQHFAFKQLGGWRLILTCCMKIK